MILLAPAPPTPLELPKEMRAQQREVYSTRESAELVVRNVLTATKLSDGVVKGLVGNMMAGNEFAKDTWPEYGMSEDIAREARKIDVPTLILGGEMDRVEPVERLRTEFLGSVRRSEMVVVRGFGHLLPIEAPREVAGYVEDFVRKVEEEK